MTPLLFGFILYLVVLIIIGFVSSRYMKSITDFFIGSWRIGPFACALSERASGESAWFLLGLPGLAYASGCESFWPVIGCAYGIFLSWTIIARKLREATGEYNAITIPDLLEAKFDDKTHIIRIISSGIILFFYTLYVSAQFIGAGKLFNAIFGISYIYGMLIGAVIIILYTVIGGYLAVVWTDVVQGLLMLFVCIFLPSFVLIKCGFTEIFSKINYINPALLNITGGKIGKELILGTAIGGLGIGLGYLGQPHLLTRYMGIHKSEQVRQGLLVAMIWVLIAYWGAAFIGIIARGTIEVVDQEQAMPILVKTFLSPWIAGIMISGAVAAMMSTADTQLLVASSSITEDIYHQIFQKKANARTLLIISRITTLFIGILSFILAIKCKELIYHLVLYAWSGLASSFGPPIILSLYWKGIKKSGVIAGLISGTAITIIWHNIPVLKNFIYELIPAFILSFAFTILFSIKK